MGERIRTAPMTKQGLRPRVNPFTAFGKEMDKHQCHHCADKFLRRSKIRQDNWQWGA
jgi:hypothetical protein